MDSKCLFLIVCCCVLLALPSWRQQPLGTLLVASARHVPAAAADVPKATASTMPRARALTGADPGVHVGGLPGGGVSEKKLGIPRIRCPLPPFCRRAPAAAADATNPP
ncbi:hypothetical protein BS78_02G026800 [Paspalum vaginatum]|nr:hypothetical protein BS78_02G026800 [Paspalum vaginatum]